MVIGASGKYRQFKPIGSNGSRFNCSKSINGSGLYINYIDFVSKKEFDLWFYI